MRNGKNRGSKETASIYSSENHISFCGIEKQGY